MRDHRRSVLNDPYQIHERNSYPAELENDVAALRDDAQLKIAVASLKHRFFSHAEALLHGDIHSGSIFVDDGSLKAIDAEFGYFGPIGFDVGTAIGNLLLNFCGLPGHLGIRDAAAAREQRLTDIQELWNTFAERFQALANEKNARRRARRAGLCLRVPEKRSGMTPSASAAPSSFAAASGFPTSRISTPSRTRRCATSACATR